MQRGRERLLFTQFVTALVLSVLKWSRIVLIHSCSYDSFKFKELCGKLLYISVMPS